MFEDGRRYLLCLRPLLVLLSQKSRAKEPVQDLDADPGREPSHDHRKLQPPVPDRGKGKRAGQTGMLISDN